MTAKTKHYLDEAATARKLNVSRRTLQRWRISGEGPRWCRLGVRRVGYPEDGIDAWAAARTFDHRAAEMARKVAA